MIVFLTKDPYPVRNYQSSRFVYEFWIICECWFVIGYQDDNLPCNFFEM